MKLSAVIGSRSSLTAICSPTAPSRRLSNQAGLTTWSVSGPDLLGLAEKLRDQPGVEQAVAFGAALHVSGDDPEALEQAIAPFRMQGYDWRQVDSGLEDVFIHLMDRFRGNSAS